MAMVMSERQYAIIVWHGYVPLILVDATNDASIITMMATMLVSMMMASAL